jgi:hypothetical protein
MLTRISFILCLFIGAASVNAAPMPKVSPSPTPSPTPVKSWSADWNSRYQFSLHGSDDANKRATVISTIALNFLANDALRIQGVLGGIQAIRPSLDFRVINPEFRAFFLLSEKKSKLKFYLGPTMVLPFGSDARDESLILGIGLGARAMLNLTKEDGSGFRTFYDLTINKNLHQFDTSVFSEINNSLALNHNFYVEYNFDSRWNLNGTLGFSSLWNYMGVLTNNYSVEQELDFQATSQIMLYLSHSRGGDFLSPNGQNYSFGLFDADSSRISLGVVVSI